MQLLEGHPDLRVAPGQGISHPDGGQRVSRGGVGIQQGHPVVGADVRQGPLALAETVHLLVDHIRIHHRDRGERGQAMTDQLPVHHREVVDGVERNHRDAGGEHVPQGLTDLGHRHRGGHALGLGLLRGDPVHGSGLGGDRHSRVHQPLIGGGGLTRGVHEHQGGGHDPRGVRVPPRGLQIETGTQSLMPGAVVVPGGNGGGRGGLRGGRLFEAHLAHATGRDGHRDVTHRGMCTPTLDGCAR